MHSLLSGLDLRLLGCKLSLRCAGQNDLPESRIGPDFVATLEKAPLPESIGPQTTLSLQFPIFLSETSGYEGFRSSQPNVSWCNSPQNFRVTREKLVQSTIVPL
jgi:hypothetical protein